MLGAGAGLSGNSKQPLTNTVSRNNIFHVWKRHWPAINEAGGSGNDFDYDLYSGKVPAGSQPHGISGVPGPDTGIDRGARLPNFNDGFLGAAPDIGAHEAGSAAMRFGLEAVVKRRQREPMAEQ